MCQNHKEYQITSFYLSLQKKTINANSYYQFVMAERRISLCVPSGLAYYPCSTVSEVTVAVWPVLYLVNLEHSNSNSILDYSNTFSFNTATLS